MLDNGAYVYGKLKKLEAWIDKMGIIGFLIVMGIQILQVAYCHIEFEGSLDVSRLQSAIARSSLYVPEVLYTYDFTRGRFVDKGFTVDDTIRYASDLLQWELNKKPQLQIAEIFQLFLKISISGDQWNRRGGIGVLLFHL